MEKTAPVKAAVEANRIVVACAYTGWIPDEVNDALPAGFTARQFVAKFVNGEMVGLATGTPEQAIQSLMGVTSAEAKPDCKSCDDRTCDDCVKPEVPRQ